MPPKGLVIAGASRAGKSTLAVRLARDFNLSRIAGDPLVTAFEKALPKNGICHGQDQGITAQNLAPFLKTFWLDTLQEEQQSFVFDGFHILPSSLPLADLTPHMGFIFLGYPRATPEAMFQRIRGHLPQGVRETTWTHELDDDALRQTLANFIRFSQRVESECSRFSLPFFDASTSWQEAHDAAYEAAKQWL